MLRPETVEWLRKQKARGYSAEQLASYLRNEGYSEQDIKTALGDMPNSKKTNTHMLPIILGIILFIVCVGSLFYNISLKAENEELAERVVSAEAQVMEQQAIIAELQNKLENIPKPTAPQEETAEENKTTEETYGGLYEEEPTVEEEETDLQVNETNTLYFPYEYIEWNPEEELHLEIQILNNQMAETNIGGKITCNDEYNSYELAQIECAYYGGYSVHYLNQTITSEEIPNGDYNCVLSVYNTDSYCEKELGNLRQKSFGMSIWP